MIKHIVMWKLKDEALGQSKKVNDNEIKQKLEALKDTIDEIVSIEVGINLVEADQAFDLVLYSEFNNMEDLSIYQKHPEHQKVADFIGQVNKERVVVDYKL